MLDQFIPVCWHANLSETWNLKQQNALVSNLSLLIAFVIDIRNIHLINGHTGLRMQ